MVASKILIVEDETIIAMAMQSILVKAGYSITGIVKTRAQVLKNIETNKPDLVLMDIELNGENTGITIAKHIQLNFQIPIIFITHLLNEEVFTTAKEAFPQSYITKPFTDSTLLHATELAILNARNRLTDKRVNEVIDDGIFFVRPGSSQKIKILFKDMLYIQAKRAYCDIYFEFNEKLKSEQCRVSLNASQVTKQIPCERIIKVHRSYYININKIDAIEKSSLIIKDKKIPVSLKYRHIIKEIRTINHNVKIK